VQCEYANPDVTEVFQGPNAATSEMCVFAAIYYPKIAGASRAAGRLRSSARELTLAPIS